MGEQQGGARADPRRPWRVRPDWHAGRIRASGWREAATRWGYFLGAAGMGACLAFAMSYFPLNTAGLIVLAVFTVVALALAAVTLWRASAFTLGHLLHGTPELLLADVPVIPCHATAAVLRTARPLRADRWELRLRCFSPIGKLEHRAELREFAASASAQPKCDATWRGELLFDRQFTPSGEPRAGARGEALLPVTLEVPPQAPPSSREAGRIVRWILSVRATSFPIILVADFDLPVFYAADGDVEHMTPAE